jgi:hypothetical protein
MTTLPSLGVTADPLLRLLRDEASLPRLDPQGWEDLARELAEEGMAGVGLTLLKRAGRIEGMPAAARVLLETELNSARARQAVLFHRFDDLAGCLSAAGVEFLVHKGGALAPLLYDRPEDRPMADIDIIFRPSAWERVRDELAHAGYRFPPGSRQAFWLENYFNLSVTSPQDPPSHFDLHWSLTQEGRYHVETEPLFSRAVPFELGPTRLLRLSNEDLLLSLFLHLAYHYFEARLIWLYDMKLILDRWPIDWDILLSRASEWGLMAVVGFNLAFLEKTFPGLVPMEPRSRARPGRLRLLMARPFLSPSARHLFRGEEMRLNQLVLGLLAIDRPADAARFAADKMLRTIRWMGRRPRRR